MARLFSSARPAAVQGLMQTAQIGAGIGGQQAQAGTSLASTGMQGLNVASNAAGNILYPFQQMRQNDLERRRQNIGIWGSIGKGVGGILADMFKNRKAGANVSGGISGPSYDPGWGGG